MGYKGSASKLSLYSSGTGFCVLVASLIFTGGHAEFVSHLEEVNEVVYGYLRVQYGNNDRTKFILVTLVPDTLSGFAKAKANMHKPFVEAYLQVITRFYLLSYYLSVFPHIFQFGLST